MKDLPLIRGRHYIASLVAEGEHRFQDFKFLISDARKIARSVSAFSNAGGGRLLIGVKDNGTIAGVRNEEDVYVVEQAATRYCDPSVEVEFTAFKVERDVVVIRASIPQAAMRPVRCQEADGSWRAYYRVADENIVAHPLMVRAWKDDRPLRLALDDEATAMMAFVDAHPDGIDPSELPLALTMSQRRADNLATKLLRAGILEFTYHAPHFLLRRAVAEADND